MPDYREEIKHLEAILNSGLAGISIAGHSNRYNLDEVRKRLAELRALDPDSAEAGLVKPRIVRVRMNHAW